MPGEANSIQISCYSGLLPGMVPTILGFLLMTASSSFSGDALLPVLDLDTPRDFPEIDSSRLWEERAKSIREQAQVSCGLWPMPEKTPLEPHIFGRMERDGYSVEKVYIQTLPGFFLAGNLYRPLGKGKGPFPAVRNRPGHWAEGRMVDNAEGSIAARCINFARQGM